MENLVFTQLSIPEVRQLFRQELEAYFAIQKQGNSNKSETDELLTVHETADFLSLAVPTIYTMVSKGLLPVMKRSKRLYFSRIDLMSYLKQGRKKTLAETASEADAYLLKKGGSAL